MLAVVGETDNDVEFDHNWKMIKKLSNFPTLCHCVVKPTDHVKRLQNVFHLSHAQTTTAEQVFLDLDFKPGTDSQMFPWQVLFARVYDINWQVFPWQGALFKSWHDQVLNKAPCQGKTCQFMSYTRTNKTCQGNLGRLYGALVRQMSVIDMHNRTINGAFFRFYQTKYKYENHTVVF